MPRNEVLEFAEEMESKLALNDHKKHWSNVENYDLFEFLQDELSELEHAFFYGEDAEVIKECADVANFAMMLADNIKNGRGGRMEED